MTTILGHHIRLIRPLPPPKSQVYKDERPIIGYDKKPKTKILEVAEFFKLCLEFVDDIERPKYWRR